MKKYHVSVTTLFTIEVPDEIEDVDEFIVNQVEDQLPDASYNDLEWEEVK